MRRLTKLLRFSYARSAVDKFAELFILWYMHKMEVSGSSNSGKSTLDVLASKIASGFYFSDVNGIHADGRSSLLDETNNFNTHMQ